MDGMQNLLSDLILFRLPGGEPAAAAALLRRSGAQRARRPRRARRLAGDLWHCCLAQALVGSENPFSLACERRQAPQDTLYALALRDMERLRALFDAPLPDADAWPLLRDFHHEGRCTGDGALLTELAAALAQADCPAQMLARLTDFYRTRGVGLLGLGQVFRAESAPGGARLTPVEERLPCGWVTSSATKSRSSSFSRIPRPSSPGTTRTTSCSTAMPAPASPRAFGLRQRVRGAGPAPDRDLQGSVRAHSRHPAPDQIAELPLHSLPRRPVLRGE